ncbi:MAG: pyruvate formate lyase-activating protein [Lachnospiraceae bacterium]|nr:pyruvate formate lyase-activating protein [Lachnospiraceae bacterium]
MKGKIHSLQSFGTVDGPGVRYVVFMQGCPMRCLYCHNPDTWPVNAGEEMEASYIIEQYKRNEGFYTDGGLTVTGGEPLLQIDFLLELFELCKQNNIHTCIDTSGITYKPSNKEYNEKLNKLLDMTDLVMLDIKHIDPDKHKELTSQPNDGILAFAELLSEKGVDTWIRHVVVPGLTDDDEYLEKLGYFIGGLKSLKALDVLPYHDMAKPKYENLGIDYPLADVPPLDKNVALEKKQVILNGIKKRRAEEGAEHHEVNHL